ncbi:leucyl-tRNA synthetase [Anopheles sinensis]|uniref:Leucyl-tRNA synthetase n=1 Tax=Anopheles sinensis TaxID=74873 RepID=A0A084VRZ3_ANOSI|nr:leucyl-tRNA synthetase [Anopheles sinensis]
MIMMLLLLLLQLVLMWDVVLPADSFVNPFAPTVRSELMPTVNRDSETTQTREPTFARAHLTARQWSPSQRSCSRSRFALPLTKQTACAEKYALVDGNDVKLTDRRLRFPSVISKATLAFDFLTHVLHLVSDADAEHHLLQSDE